jgi:hypothetical protein
METKMKNMVLAVVLFALSHGAHAIDAEVQPKTSFGTDFTDIWWFSNESGWGMPMHQQHNLLYATLYIYGADGKPTWVSALLTAGPSSTFSGQVIVSSGPWYGGAFNPSNVGRRVAGNITVQFDSVTTGVVTYSIDGVTVTKPIERLTMTYEHFEGNYLAAVNLTQSSCFDSSANGSGTGLLGLTVAHTGTQMASTLVFPNGGSCVYTGAYGQDGSKGRFSGTYACSTGEVGTMQFFEMSNRRGMISGRLQGSSTNAGCRYTGRFTGLDPSVP